MASKTASKRREKGAGSIYKRKQHFYLKIRINDKDKTTILRNPDGSPCTTREEAMKASGDYRQMLLAKSKETIAVHIAEAKKLKRHSLLKVEDAWDTFLKQPGRPDCSERSFDRYALAFRQFMEWLRNEHPEVDNVASIDHSIALEYFGAVWSRGVSAATYNIYLQALRLIFRNLMEPAALDVNPFEGIQNKSKEVFSRKEFSLEQVQAIFNGFKNGFFYEVERERFTTGRERERVVKQLEFKPKFKDEMRVLLNLCCWTGCRGEDGCQMTWDNVDLEAALISYIPRKTAKRTGYHAVTLPLAPPLRDALQDALTWRFQNPEGKDYIIPHVAERFLRNPSGVQKDVMKIIHCATGLETTASEAETFGRRKIAANAYSLHSFRHTFVSFCANTGVPFAVVAEIVGHGNPAMTEHYSHISTAAKQEAINALPALKEIPMPAGTQLSSTGEMDGVDDNGVISTTVSIIPAEPVDPLAELRRKAIDGIKKAKKRTLQKILALLG